MKYGRHQGFSRADLDRREFGRKEGKEMTTDKTGKTEGGRKKRQNGEGKDWTATTNKQANLGGNNGIGGEGKLWIKLFK
jgi:hypothetical protein